MKKIAQNWYLILIGGFLVFAGLVFLICGQDSVIAVHDNLDLFVPQFQMMKNEHLFWTHGEYASFLGGIDRNVLPSEFSLYTLLYMLLPSFAAYIVGYLLKIVIAVLSCVFLAKDVYGENYGKYRALVYVTGFAYGVLNVFPAFGIPFASIPLVIALLRKINRGEGNKWYLALFFYPLLSYFSYFGLFILAYMAVTFLWLWLKDKKFPLRFFLAILVLSLGYVVCEYRLFDTMLFDDTETIRVTMEAGSLGLAEILKTMGDSLARGMFHAESVHTYLVLPVCVLYFLYVNGAYLKKKNIRGIFHEPYNLVMLLLVFNSAVYGLYYWEGLRRVVEKICPPLTGWQFNRTIFFNPFLWYGAFFLVLKRLYDGVGGEKKERLQRWLANGLAVAAVLVIVCSGTRYNDLYHTCVSQVYQMVKGQKSEPLSYREFYSTELFEMAKEDIGYDGQWAAAYGFYPAVLEYNGISTIDGYLGFYSQDYKIMFRKVIAPALERVEESREYYDSWGARAYLYSGTQPSIVSAGRSISNQPEDIYIDLDAFKRLEGRYIFSRLELTNAKEAGLTLEGVYTHKDSPYTLYVYRTTSRYQTKEHANLTFEEMQKLTYDKAYLQELLEEMTALAQEADASLGEQADGDKIEVLDEKKMLGLYQEAEKEHQKLLTCQKLAEISCYQDVYDQEAIDRQGTAMEDGLDLSDQFYAVLREVCRSPYQDTMKTVLQPGIVEGLCQYEEMTEREKEIRLRDNALFQEYQQAAGEDYTISYQGEEWDFARFGEEGGNLAQEDQIAVYQALNKEKNSVLGEIFLEQVQLRTELARLNDYDNYAEYAYEQIYGRDYSVKEAKKLFEQVRKKVVPVYQELQEACEEIDTGRLWEEGKNLTSTEIYDAIYPYVMEMDPELGESLAHIRTYKLCDLNREASGARLGVTVQLPSFGDGYIYLAAYDSLVDYQQMIHEFGHYNYTYRNTENILESVSNIDFMEIHSQGLEMLLYDYYDEIMGEEAGTAFKVDEILFMLDNVVDALQVSEFEIEVYTHPDMSLEDINKLYLKLAGRYGNRYVSEIRELYDWMNIQHLFNVPCYYISYATSALSSLDLLAMSEQNRPKAVETYMELTTLPSYGGYCNIIEYVGLRDIFKKDVPGEIAGEVRDALLADIGEASQ